MAGSVNKVILIGNIGKDPEVRRLENGAVVASFSLATSETYVDRTTGERRDTTDWHNIVCWRGLAEIVEKYVRKGSKIYIEGKLKTRSWQDREGNTRYTTEVLADELTLLSRPENSNERNSNATSGNVYSTEATPTPPSPMHDMMSDDDDDILPF